MRVSCGTITNSLLRYEEINKRLVAQEGQQQAALLKLKVAEDKGNNEAAHLRARVQELEQQQDMLVSHEELEEKTEEIEHIRLELKYREKENNLLVQRYSVLKSAIEVAFTKQLTCTATTLSDIVLLTGQEPSTIRAGALGHISMLPKSLTTATSKKEMEKRLTRRGSKGDYRVTR